MRNTAAPPKDQRLFLGLKGVEGREKRLTELGGNRAPDILQTKKTGSVKKL